MKIQHVGILAAMAAQLPGLGMTTTTVEFHKSSRVDEMGNPIDVTRLVSTSLETRDEVVYSLTTVVGDWEYETLIVLRYEREDFLSTGFGQYEKEVGPNGEDEEGYIAIRQTHEHRGYYEVRLVKAEEIRLSDIEPKHFFSVVDDEIIERFIPKTEKKAA